MSVWECGGMGEFTHTPTLLYPHTPNVLPRVYLLEGDQKDAAKDDDIEQDEHRNDEPVTIGHCGLLSFGSLSMVTSPE